MSRLGDDWVLGPDGLRHRSAARVLLFDDRDRILLAQGRDWNEPSRRWWFTIGGGLEPGEDARAGAVRELAEETGYVLSAQDLVGPVLSRSAIFDFFAETVRQEEVFFLARLHHHGRIDTTAWTDIEQDTILTMQWLTIEQVRALPDQVYPVGLADLAEELARGWNGVTRHLEQAYDPAPERRPADPPADTGHENE